MLHKTLEAKATTTDLGEFTAIAAAYSVDRMNERIVPGAFKGTIAAWKDSGKNIPLHWDHSGDAKNIIGAVDPATMMETDAGLQVSGKLDLEESDTAREAWRSMKANRVALSFGYLILSDGKAEDGVRELKSLDLYEVSITPAPANPDTRFIDMKSVEHKREMAREFVAEVQELRNEVKERSDLLQDALTEGDRLRKAADELTFDVTTRDVKASKPEVKPEPEAKDDEPMISRDEFEGAKSGELKAVWTAAYVNDLPDSAFLHVESGGKKDGEGKTVPRSLRHFPVKDASGNVDLPHLRNALARIPQSNLPQDVKDRLTQKAQTMLDNAKAVEDARTEDRETGKVEAQDPLRKGYEDLAKLMTRGIDVAEPPKVEEEPTEAPPSVEELRRHHADLMLNILTEGTQ